MSLDLDATPPTEEFEITETVDETVIAPKRKKITSNAEKLQALGMISTLSSSAEERIDRASFIHYRETIEEGDIVIIHITSQTLKAIKVERGKTLNMQMGALRHEFLIGKPYGSRITTTNGFVHALRPNPVLWSRSLKRFTQILYQHDIATIIMLLDVTPGSVICESGTGSGSLTHALAVAVGRHGHVYTHDVVEARVKAIEQDLSEHGLGERTTCILQDVYEDGFFVTNSCDGVFLDLPEPWRAIEHAKNAISRARGGRLVSFSPCVEQVVKSIEEMKNHGFHLIETIEVIPTTMKVSTRKQRTFQSFLGEPPAKKERLEKSASAPEAPTIGGDDDEAESPQTEAEDLAPDEADPAVKKEHPQKFDYKDYFVAKPVKQATHSGYLTSATLLPY